MAKKVVSSFLEAKNLIEKNVRSGMNAARDEVEIKLEDNVLGYYDFGNPIKYERTGTLLESPNTTPVSGGANHFEFKAEMQDNISYHTGNFSGSDVIEATETGAFGNTLGNHRYFEATRKAVPEIVDRNMSKYLK
nr:MAG TPA: hypothetical protein [Caudoviricetes sp.]